MTSGIRYTFLSYFGNEMPAHMVTSGNLPPTQFQNFSKNFKIEFPGNST